MNDISEEKELAMVDFWSVCDDKGNPVGHGVKVGNEYFDIIKDHFLIKQYVNSGLTKWICNERTFPLWYKHNTAESKLARIMRGGLNIFGVYRNEKNIWFYVPDIYLFVFLLFLPKRKHKIIVNIYEMYSSSVLKNFVFKQALKKIDLAIVTNPNILTKFPRRILIQDYYYNASKYMKYRCENKQERCVCLGTMNSKKCLIELVEVFSKNGYQLVIVGQFSDKYQHAEITRLKSSNIIIEDKYLEEEEYYNLLSSSKYCALPYDTAFYKNRTSGVVQESVFMNTIPIAPKEMLEFSEIPGIGYDNIKELENIDLFNVKCENMYDKYEKLMMEKYDVELIKKTIIDGIESIL